MELAPAARTTLRCLAVAARAVARGVSWTASAAWTHRARLNAIALRVAWWAALWLALTTASTIFDVRSTLVVDDALQQLGLGLGLCWAVVVFSAARHLRWAGIALGTIHGALALLLWTASGG